jgi:hypothetical protein
MWHQLICRQSGFNCGINSHHVVTVVLDGASLKAGTQHVSNMVLFITVSTVGNIQKVLRTQITSDSVVEEHDM